MSSKENPRNAYSIYNDQVKLYRQQLEQLLKNKDNLNSSLSKKLVQRDSLIMQDKVLKDIVKKRKSILKAFSSHLFQIVVTGRIRLDLELDDHEIVCVDSKLVVSSCTGKMVTPRFFNIVKQELSGYVSSNIIDFFGLKLEKEEKQLNILRQKSNPKGTKKENFRDVQLTTNLSFKWVVDCDISFPNLSQSFQEFYEDLEDEGKFSPSLYNEMLRNEGFRVKLVDITPKDTFDYFLIQEFLSESIFTDLDITYLKFKDSQFVKDFIKSLREFYNMLKKGSEFFEIGISELGSIIEDIC